MGGAAALRLVGMQACVRVDAMGLGDGLGGVQVRRGGWGHAAIGETGRTPSRQCDLRPGFVELERGFWHLVQHLALDLAHHVHFTGLAVKAQGQLFPCR